MNEHITIQQMDEFLNIVAKLKSIETSLVRVSKLLHHETYAWRAFLACQRREWLKQVRTLTEIVSESDEFTPVFAFCERNLSEKQG